ncbi:hypothetical protein ACFP8W_21855, partial [Nocardioides hankookensis]
DSAQDGLTRLAPSLEGAVATVAEVLRSLDELRNGPAELETTTPAVLEQQTPVADADTVEAEQTEAEQTEVEPATGVTSEAKPEDTEARPLGWLFRASQT